MDHQRPDGGLIDPRNLDPPHRAAVGAKALDRRLLLCRQQITGRLPRQVRCPGKGRQFRRHAIPAPVQLLRDDGKHLVSGTIEIELKLAVLINGPERVDGRSAEAVLAHTLCPQLAIPARERCQCIGIGHEHAHARTLALQERQ